MQTSTYGASSSSFTAAKFVMQHDGVRGFYRGFLTTIMREVHEYALTLYDDQLIQYLHFQDTLYITSIPAV
jgi:solute carrier family 25 S-adenosylmethionine transporter 26